jgi:hypothetical protein
MVLKIKYLERVFKNILDIMIDLNYLIIYLKITTIYTNHCTSETVLQLNESYIHQLNF